ncbi:hypothetical protein H1R20_g6220, partial [Candolleomyces eurysporus]
MASTTTSPDSFTFTVGKLDAGMAILLGDRAHLIEFPSILLPPGATTGSIVNIAVHQNHLAERKRDSEFWALQDSILDTYGSSSPQNPELQVRNVTQTSVTLEWPPVELATSKLRSLDIYRNGQRLAAIPAPLTNTSTKVSGLDLNTEYSFQLILRTTAGTFPSNLIRVRTHTITDTSGICVCFGNVQDEVLLENAKMALREMGARWSEKIQIDTTHFVCTTPAATPTGAQASGSQVGAPGVEYQRALQLSIPVVQPHWILACLAEKRMVPIAQYYLGATPSGGPASASVYSSSGRPQSMSYGNLPHSAPVGGPSNRASMPPSRTERTIKEDARDDDDTEEVDLQSASAAADEETSRENKRKSRAGTMNKGFKFPPEPSSPQEGSPSPETTPTAKAAGFAHAKKGSSGSNSDGARKRGLDKGKQRESSPASTSNIEVPPPPPVEKETPRASLSDTDDDLGDDTVDIPL